MPAKAKAPKTTPEATRGRPSSYTEQMGDLICDRLCDGESLREICRDESMPGKATVFRWLHGHPIFRDQYARAREEQADALADEIVSIADEECTMVRSDKHGSKDDGDGQTEVIFDSTAVARNRLRVDARKWVASKLKPKSWGDKVEARISGDAENPLVLLMQQLSGTALSPVAQDPEHDDAGSS